MSQRLRALTGAAFTHVPFQGGGPANTALLDNFCWGRSDDERQLGGLVRAWGFHDDVMRAHLLHPVLRFRP